MYNQDQTHNSIEQMLLLLSLYEDGNPADKKHFQQEEILSLEAANETKKFLDMIPGGFFIYHADGNKQIIFANKAMLKIFGCANLAEFRELTGNSFTGIVHPDDLISVEDSIKEQILSSQEDLDYVEYRIIRQDGTVRWVEDYGHFVHSETVGDIFYVFISDATEKISRRLNEKDALISEKQEKEQKLQNLIEEHDKERSLFQQEDLQRLKVIEGLSINYDSILYADLDEDKVLPYRLSSRTEYHFEKKLQIRKFSRLTRDYADTWVHSEDKERILLMTTPEYIRKELSENDSFYINFRCNENGTTKFLQLRIVNVGSKNHISQIVLGYRSIDDEMLHEMKQKAVLEDALKNANLASVAKNTFLSNMSHDMRTPLNAIFGYTALAKKNIWHKKRVKSYLDKIDTASRQILDLISNVLELTYMESQDFRFNESAYNVCTIAHEVYKNILTKAQEKNIALYLHTDVNRGDVYTDNEKLTQVLLHLADNAVKYTKSGGSVHLTVKEINNQSLSDEFSSYQFIVQDTGIGIGKDALPHIFDPFEREQNTTLAGVYGLGLGLTISKQIIERMGGNIKAESETGKGSTFTVSLDLRLQNFKETKSKTSSSPPKFKGKKILIAEDNQINLEIETELLKDLGFSVDSALNGKICVDKIKSAKPDEYLFILMDIQMPVMDGRQAAEEIRNLDNRELAGIPIIALSANAFESDIKASLESGMNAHLTKPINLPLLMETVEKIITN